MNLPLRDLNGRFTPKKRRSKISVQATLEPITHVAIVLDESGSMQGYRQEAVDLVYKNLRTIVDESAARKQSGTVSVLTFSGYSIKSCLEGAPVKQLDPDSLKLQFSPDGGTNLWDAVGSAIDRLGKLGTPDDSRLVIVVTDGEENRSQYWTAARLQATIDDLQATDRWSFAFLVPPGHKKPLLKSLGVPAGNVQEWETTCKGLEVATATVSASLQTYYGAREQGLRSTSSFYNTDMSGVTKKDIVNKLDDISGLFAKWRIDREVPIAEFCRERNGGVYNKGSGYYQLTKDEVIQPYKNILVMEKNKSAVWGGPQARSLIGLPPSGEIKVRPGNHGNYDIFVQSTSSNRKLVRGTTLLYQK